MIVYLDASALVKRYVAEANSQAVTSLITKADTVGSNFLAGNARRTGCSSHL